MGEAAGRQGVLYDLIRSKREPWTRLDESGRREYLVYMDVAQRIETRWAAEDSIELVSRMEPPAFAAGDRVRIAESAYWAKGQAATVNPGGWSNIGSRIERRLAGPTRVYFVFFDTPQDDGSGDGPYRGGEFAEAELVATADGAAIPRVAKELEAIHSALTEIMNDPTRGTQIRPRLKD